MYCSQCGTKNADDAQFCVQCANPMAGGQPMAATAGEPASTGELASMGQRAGSYVVDFILEAIPYVGFVIYIINLVKFRRGSTIGLGLVGARIVRENGDVSGFYHTAVRGMAAVLSMIPLGLGFWWAFWDPGRQTWHDKMLHTYVMRDTPELAARRGTSSRAAVIWFWVLLAVALFIAALVIAGG